MKCERCFFYRKKKFDLDVCLRCHTAIKDFPADECPWFITNAEARVLVSEAQEKKRHGNPFGHYMPGWD